MFIEASGSTKERREMAEDVAAFALNLMAPRLLGKVEVDIKLINNLRDQEELVGDCTWEDSRYRPRHFTVRIDAAQDKHDMLETVAHEMVHVKQYARGELKDTNHLSLCKWKDKVVDSDKVNYYDQPWEIEAHGRERGLFFRWIAQSNWKKCRWIKY